MNCAKNISGAHLRKSRKSLIEGIRRIFNNVNILKGAGVYNQTFETLITF